MGGVRERVENCWDVQTWNWYKSSVNCLFLSSAFGRLVQGYIKALNHCTFFHAFLLSRVWHKNLKTKNSQRFQSSYLLLTFLFSRISYWAIPRHRITLDSTRKSREASWIYDDLVHRTVPAFLFLSTLDSLAQRMTSIRFSPGLLRSLWIEISLVYIIFPKPKQSLRSNLPPAGCTWSRLRFNIPPTQSTWHFR